MKLTSRTFVKTEAGFDMGLAYTKIIPLAGPVSLMLDYAATNALPRHEPRKIG